MDGSPVDTRDNSRISFSADKKVLTITNASRTDSGEYRCVARNSLGNATSDASAVDFQYQPKITVHPQTSPTTTEGGNLTLSCNATGNPVPTISWTRDGSPVNANGRISFLDDKKQLTITNVNRTDRGDYQCVASNSLGNDTSNVATLNVQFAPEISDHPEGVTTEEGQDVVFSCVVGGNPPPSVSWTKNGQRLNVTANSRLNVSRTNNSHNLTITDVHRSDAGQYRCVANNSVGNSTSSVAKLEVYCVLFNIGVSLYSEQEFPIAIRQ